MLTPLTKERTAIQNLWEIEASDKKNDAKHLQAFSMWEEAIGITPWNDSNDTYFGLSNSWTFICIS